MSELGEKIRAARKERSLSQRELAKLADVALTTVQRIENGIGSINRNTLTAVLVALDKTSPLNAELSKELEKTSWIPLEEFVKNREEQQKDEEGRWKADLPLLHQRIDLIDHYADFKAVFDLVDRLRSYETAIKYSTPRPVQEFFVVSEPEEET